MARQQVARNSLDTWEIGDQYSNVIKLDTI